MEKVRDFIKKKLEEMLPPHISYKISQRVVWNNGKDELEDYVVLYYDDGMYYGESEFIIVDDIDSLILDIEDAIAGWKSHLIDLTFDTWKEGGEITHHFKEYMEDFKREGLID